MVTIYLIPCNTSDIGGKEPVEPEKVVDTMGCGVTRWLWIIEDYDFFASTGQYQRCLHSCRSAAYDSNVEDLILSVHRYDLPSALFSIKTYFESSISNKNRLYGGIYYP